MERSTETIIALLAILKAGGVYLPLDVAYPPDRLAYMIADAGAKLVITKHSTTLAEGVIAEGVQCVFLDDQDDATSLPSLARPLRTPSSGLRYLHLWHHRPAKGVAVSHAAAVNLAFARRVAHDPIGPGDRYWLPSPSALMSPSDNCCCRCSVARPSSLPVNLSHGRRSSGPSWPGTASAMSIRSPRSLIPFSMPCRAKGSSWPG